MGELTQEKIRSLFWYDPCTGIFYHKKNMKQAGSRNDMYTKISINYKLHYAHRLVFLYLIGYIPDKCIDHINGDKKDNRFENLRICRNGQSDNNQNNKMRSDNKTGFIGVGFDSRRNKFYAQITSRKNKQFLGYFDTAQEAHFVYKERKLEAHTFNPVLGEHQYG